MWAYVKSADAETGVQSESVATSPEEDKITIVWEKYDQFPPIAETKDTSKWTSGFGLMYDEKARLISLKAEYDGGRRPEKKAPNLPTATGFAILPLDASSFGGISEYYFLPETLLTDEQLLQLIAYSHDKGASFTADMLTEKNSKRGSSSYLSNRLPSAGEQVRTLNLSKRAYEILPVPEAYDFSVPVAGVAYIPLIPDKSGGSSLFVLLPLRALTDEEILELGYMFRDKEYATLDPAREKYLHPEQDAAQLRDLLEDICLMPISAEHRSSSYVRKESTGEIRLDCEFSSALINGKQTGYSIVIDYQSKQLIFLMAFLVDHSTLETGISTGTEYVFFSGENTIDSKWMQIAKASVERFDKSGIVKLKFNDESGYDEETISEVSFWATMKNGGSYLINIRYSDGAVVYVAYAPKGQIPWEWATKNQW